MAASVLGSFTPDPARHGTVRHVPAQRRTSWYGLAVAAFTLEFSICIALHCGDARHRNAPCRAVPDQVWKNLYPFVRSRTLYF